MPFSTELTQIHDFGVYLMVFMYDRVAREHTKHCVVDKIEDDRHFLLSQAINYFHF